MRYDSIFMEGYNVPPVLSKEESYILIDKAQSGDKSARDKIIEHNLRLVMMVVKSFKNTPYEFNDLLSYGIIGLINAEITMIKVKILNLLHILLNVSKIVFSII